MMFFDSSCDLVLKTPPTILHIWPSRRKVVRNRPNISTWTNEFIHSYWWSWSAADFYKSALRMHFSCIIFALVVLVSLEGLDSFKFAQYSSWQRKSRSRHTMNAFSKDAELCQNSKFTPSQLTTSIYNMFGLVGLLMLSTKIDTVGELAQLLEPRQLQTIETDISAKRKVLGTLTKSYIGSKFSNQFTLVVPDKKTQKGRSTVFECMDISEWQKSGTFKFAVIKNYPERDRFQYELNNYQIICGKRGDRNFIRIQDSCIDKTPSCYGRIVLERGSIDLRRAREASENVQINVQVFKSLVRSMVDSLSQIHSKGLVWTDLKLDNFILVNTRGDTELSASARGYFADVDDTQFDAALQFFNGKDYALKATDLESAVPEGQPMRDFSAEGCAPEQAETLGAGQLGTVGGRSSDLRLNLQEPLIASKASDIWSLGISILHLYTGVPPIVPNSDVRKAVAKVRTYMEGDGSEDLGLGTVQDPLLRRLLQSMLQVDASKRPSIQGVKASLFLLSP